MPRSYYLLPPIYHSDFHQRIPLDVRPELVSSPKLQRYLEQVAILAAVVDERVIGAWSYGLP